MGSDWSVSSANPLLEIEVAVNRDAAGLPAAVETSNEANCRLYEHLGFRAAGDRISPDGELRVWVLVRPAQR